MKIAVAGLGAIGLWLAGRLLAAGHEVRCLARGATLEALQRDGLRLTFEGQESATPVFATDDPKALGPVDLLLLTPKSQALPALAAQLAPAITQATTDGLVDKSCCGCQVVSFGTEAGLFQKAGIATVVCGPGSIRQAHKADEYVATSQLNACLVMFDRLIEQLTSHP